MTQSQFTTSKPKSQKITGNGEFVFSERPVEDFTVIEVNGNLDVEFKQKDTLSLKVHSDSNLQDIIETTIKDGVLSVSVKAGVSYQTKSDMYVECSAPVLRTVNVYDNGDISIKKLDGESFSGQIVGNGDMTVKGKVERALFDISGSGDLDARKLIAKKVEISVSGNGDAEIHASESVGVALSGNGDIEIYGNPSVREIEQTGNGDIDFE